MLTVANTSNYYSDLCRNEKCDYDDFYLSVEVTMQMWQPQYETGGEPITRHLAKLKREMGKPSYCLFIAPVINKACVAFFYTIYKTSISYLVGYSTIIPLPLNIFEQMVQAAHNASYVPTPQQVRRFFVSSIVIAMSSSSEIEWYSAIKREAVRWLQ